jgi:hypothetical protein
MNRPLEDFFTKATHTWHTRMWNTIFLNGILKPIHKSVIFQVCGFVAQLTKLKKKMALKVEN